MPLSYASICLCHMPLYASAICVSDSALSMPLQYMHIASRTPWLWHMRLHASGIWECMPRPYAPLSVSDTCAWLSGMGVWLRPRLLSTCKLGYLSVRWQAAPCGCGLCHTSRRHTGKHGGTHTGVGAPRRTQLSSLPHTFVVNCVVTSHRAHCTRRRMPDACLTHARPTL